MVVPTAFFFCLTCQVVHSFKASITLLKVNIMNAVLFNFFLIRQVPAKNVYGGWFENLSHDL